MRKTKPRNEDPARDYLSSERRAFQVRFSRQPEAVILFPAPYPTGIANLGFLRIWESLNSLPNFACDRAFWDSRSKAPPRGLETDLPLKAFPLVFVSSSFELDLLEVIKALLAADIEPERSSRSDQEPLIILGGLVPTLNPAPWGPVVDLAILGEGEEAVQQWIKVNQDWRQTRTARDELREMSGNFPFVWLPHQLDRSVEPARFQNYVDDPAVSTAVHPQGHFGDCWLVEMTRGCPRNCQFCAVCGVYPARFASWEAVSARWEETEGLGTGKVGLVGGAVGDHPALKPLIKNLLDRGRKVTVSSLRIERTDQELIELLSAAGMETLTVAPEAGSEALRFRLGKKATDEDLVTLVRRVGKSQLRKLRFYFLIGLPDPEDPQEIVKLIRALRREAPSRLRLDLSVSSFIPKPGTAWERAPFGHPAELDRVKELLRLELRHLAGVALEFENTNAEQRAALLSRGDYRVGEAALRAIKRGRSLEQELRLSGAHLEQLLDFFAQSGESLPWGQIKSRS